MAALTSRLIEPRFLTVLTSGCVTTRNFLATKISPFHRKSLRLKDDLLAVIEGEGEVSEDTLANERCIA
jgi:hypothetical protein